MNRSRALISKEVQKLSRCSVAVPPCPQPPLRLRALLPPTLLRLQTRLLLQPCACEPCSSYYSAAPASPLPPFPSLPPSVMLETKAEFLSWRDSNSISRLFSVLVSAPWRVPSTSPALASPPLRLRALLPPTLLRPQTRLLLQPCACEPCSSYYSAAPASPLPPFPSLSPSVMLETRAEFLSWRDSN